jgi:hypothetical protein
MVFENWLYRKYRIVISFKFRRAVLILVYKWFVSFLFVSYASYLNSKITSY